MRAGADPGGMWGMHPPHQPFSNMFLNEFSFSIISNLFDNSKPYALSTHNQKCTVRTKCIIFGETLRFRGKNLYKIYLKIVQKVLKWPLQYVNFQKIFLESMLPDPPRAFFSICFKIILHEKKNTLENLANLEAPSLKKFLNASQT